MIALAQNCGQADFLCCLAAGFFAAVSFAAFLPASGISISLWPAVALCGFLPDFFGALASAAAAPPTLCRSASIRSTTLSPRGRSFGVIGLPLRFWLIRSINAVS
jgi:hypothetical protein